MEPIIRVDHLTHTYSAGTPFQRSAVQDMSLDILPGEFLGIIGHTGSGKSTLIQHLNGLLKPTEGHIYLNGQDIWADPKNIRQVRFHVGLVFQYPEYQLFEETVYKDVAFGPKNMGLDEPTAGLDPRGCEDILSLLRDYHARRGSTVVLVSHSMEEIARNARRIIVLDRGGVSMQGTPAEVFARARELESIGLDVPQVTKIAHALHEKGVAIDPAVYTVEALRSQLLALKGGRDLC